MAGTASQGDETVIGFDLGGTKMYAVAFDGTFEPLGSARQPTGGHRGAEEGIERIVETIEAALEDAGRRPSDLVAVGLGCPGIVDMKNGVLRSTPNLGWPDVPLRKAIGKRFDCPVAVLNDVDAGTYGEFVRGAGRGARSVLGVFPGTGVGAGCIYDGRLLAGNRYSAMEIGRMRWPAPGRVSAPGEWPIFETFCSRLAIASAAAEEAFRGNAPALMKKAGTDIAKIKSKTLLHALERKDPGVLRVLENAITCLSAGIGAVVNLIAPDRVVLGGGLVEAMPDFFVDNVRKHLDDFAAAELLESIKVVVAELGDEAAVTGAAAVAADMAAADTAA